MNFYSSSFHSCNSYIKPALLEPVVQPGVRVKSGYSSTHGIEIAHPLFHPATSGHILMLKGLHFDMDKEYTQLHTTNIYVIMVN